jgi:urea transport system permease protein
MFTLQIGFLSPRFVGIVPSIEMVIFAAVGGRMSLIGAVYGTLLVNFGKTMFSETYPELWLFLMGGLFIAVVMFFPDGLAGVYQKYADKFKIANIASKYAAKFSRNAVNSIGDKI